MLRSVQSVKLLEISNRYYPTSAYGVTAIHFLLVFGRGVTRVFVPIKTKTVCTATLLCPVTCEYTLPAYSKLEM